MASARSSRPPTRNIRCVAVTGASGTVGQFVVQHLLAQGVEVRAASRDPAAVEAQGSGQHPALQWRPLELGNFRSAQALLRGCDALVHCAFDHIDGRYRGGEGNSPARFWQRNLDGTLQLLEGCIAASTGRAIILSSRAVFGPKANTTASPDSVLTDSSHALPDTHYGALKRAEESLVRELARNTELAAASVRPTGVYGVLSNPQRSKWYEDCLAVTRDEPITRVRASTEVHGEDVAAAIWQLLTADSGALDGRAYNCSDQLVSTRMLARELNVLSGKTLPLPTISQPVGLPMACAGLRALGWQPLGQTRLRSHLHRLLQVAAVTAARSQDSSAVRQTKAS